MTRKGGKRKAGLNKSILSVGFGTLNQMITYKIEQKGGLVLMFPTQTLKPLGQRKRLKSCCHGDGAEATPSAYAVG